MTNPEFHTCPDCGYQWRHGQHGGHSCAQYLKPRIEAAEKLRDELLAALEEVVTISDRKHDAWDRAHAVIDKAKGGAA